MKHTAAILCLFVGLTGPLPAVAQTTEAAVAAKEEDLAKAVTDPAAFARLAASSNMLEIESSTLALERSQNADVQAFAQKMIDDHTAAGEKMQAAAKEAGVEVPTEMNEADQQALQAFLDLQTKAHDEAVSLFEAFSTGAEDSALRGFASETLPKLQEHQTQARDLNGA